MTDMKSTYQKVQKAATGQGDDYTTGCFLYYDYFKEHYQLIAIYFSKLQILDSDPKAIEQTSFTVKQKV